MSGYEARGWFDNNQFVIKQKHLISHGYASNYYQKMQHYSTVLNAKIAQIL